MLPEAIHKGWLLFLIFTCFFEKSEEKPRFLGQKPRNKTIFLLEITFTFAPLTKKRCHEIK
jgi:hypothetical protein